MTFCWYGVEDASDPQVTAYGNRWASQDKEEKSFEWITELHKEAFATSISKRATSAATTSPWGRRC
jgi:hypothetical protein